MSKPISDEIRKHRAVDPVDNTGFEFVIYSPAEAETTRTKALRLAKALGGPCYEVREVIREVAE